MALPYFSLIYFFYGLSFFCMGVVIMQEINRCSDPRLQRGLGFLAAFGLVHGVNEWVEMFQVMGLFSNKPAGLFSIESVRVAILAISFLSLGTFGVTLLASNPLRRRLALLVPLSLTGIWSLGLVIFAGRYTLETGLWNVVDVWTRYSLAIPSAWLACAGLVYQQREFRRAGMAQFGRDALWASVTFAWYGVIGQIFTRPSPLPPSNVINSSLFLDVFGFPIQLLRAMAAIIAAFFVVRFLRSFQVETQRKIDALQQAQLEEAQRRETLRGELLRRVVAAQESERQRIARELHDETGQTLTALGLGLRGAATHLREDPEKAANNLRQLERLVGHSMDELQRIIGDLRPSHLDDLGLAAAIRWYCGEIQKRSDLNVSVEIQGESGEMSAEIKTAIFRIAQEALVNVVRHAQANQAQVHLNFEPEHVHLVVQDDGCGFDAASMRESTNPAWGLLGMEERATLLGGTVEIRSAYGRGTQVAVTIPYHSDGKEVKDEYTAITG